MKYEPKKVEIAVRNGFEEVSRDSGAPFRKTQRYRRGLGLRNICRPVIDDAMQIGIDLHQAVKQRAGRASDINGHEALRCVETLCYLRGNTRCARLHRLVEDRGLFWMVSVIVGYMRSQRHDFLRQSRLH